MNDAPPPLPVAQFIALLSAEPLEARIEFAPWDNVPTDKCGLDGSLCQDDGTLAP
jgi:hypothetical protein